MVENSESVSADLDRREFGTRVEEKQRDAPRERRQVGDSVHDPRLKLT